MNIKRLTILRDALIQYAKAPGNLKFDLDTWGSASSKYAYDNPIKVIRGAMRGENYCGTTACAMGLAVTIPAFREAGLRATPFGEEGLLGVSYHPPGSGFWGSPLKDVFGISAEDFDELFMPEKYHPQDRKNPLAVADKITALLETA